MVSAVGLSEVERAERIADLRRRIAGMPGGAARAEAGAPVVAVGAADDQGAVAPSGERAPGASGGRSGGVPRGRSEGPALPSGLADLLPGGVLPAGRVVGVSGGAGLRTGLLAAATASGARCAVLGYPELGLAAVSEQGGDLDRIALVPDPGADGAAVVSVLLEGFDVVLVDPRVCVVSPSRGRVLAGRARVSGAVLLVGPAWPGLDVLVQSDHCTYGGLGPGHGCLDSLVRSVRGSGRSMLPRSVEWAVGRAPCTAEAAGVSVLGGGRDVTGSGPVLVERAG